MTVGFGIKPNLLTLDDVLARHQGARGLMQLPAITAGGEFHPALRTLPRQDGRGEIIINPTGKI